MNVVAEIAPTVGIVVACGMLALARATYYRARAKAPAATSVRTLSPRALSAEERAGVLAVLHEPRFLDLALQ